MYVIFIIFFLTELYLIEVKIVAIIVTQNINFLIYFLFKLTIFFINS